MKRFLTCILTLIVVLSVCTTAFAAGKTTYMLEELGMNMDLPSDYVVFTREIDDKDPNLSKFGLDKSAMLKMMEEGNIYLNACDQGGSFEIVVTMTENLISNFNLIEDSDLLSMAELIKKEYAGIGATVDRYEVYHQHDQAKFVKIHFKQPHGNGTAYEVQYYTIFDNKAINVTMHSYVGKIDSKKDALMEDIVKSIYFGKDLALKKLAKDVTTEINAATYVDRGTDAMFIVPKGWKEEPLSKKAKVVKAKFVNEKEPGTSILFGSYDVWDDLSSADKKTIKRAEIDQSAYDLDFFAEAMGVDVSKVKRVTHGGKEYFQYTGMMNGAEFGVNMEVMMTYLMRFENGYGYIFQFTGDSTSPYYQDFEKLMRTVSYPFVWGEW